MATQRICSVEGCGKSHSARGLCGAHYRKWKRYGDPLAGGTRTANGKPFDFIEKTVLPYDGDECILWPFAKTERGYPIIYLDGHNTTASRLVCEITNGPAPTPAHQAAHSCGNGHLACVTKGHLRWATVSENKADMVDHGTRMRGAAIPTAKLSEQDVRVIRSLEGSMSRKAIAERYGVTASLVWCIFKRKAWGWLE